MNYYCLAAASAIFLTLKNPKTQQNHKKTNALKNRHK